MNLFKFVSNNEDLGHTPLENIFINHYMPMAPGDYVKVYILGLKYALSPYNNTLSNEIIAKTLNMSVEEVLSAWRYWTEQGVVRLSSTYAAGGEQAFTIEFQNIIEKMLNIKAPKPEIGKYSPERIINARQNFKIKDMFDYIRRITGRELSQNEMFTFLDWIDDYLMPPEVILLIIEDCFSRGKKDLPYIKQVAKNWFDAGVTSLEKANEYLLKHKEKWQKYGKVLNFLRMGRPTAIEEEMMHKWFYNYNYNEEIILKACEATINTRNPSFAYIDKIITAWYEKGLQTLPEIEAYMTKTTAVKEEKTYIKEESKPYKAKKSTFNNFENRTYDTKLLKEQLLKKSRGELNG